MGLDWSNDFEWKYPLYYPDHGFKRFLYARFVGYLPLPSSSIDLSARGSDLFDKAYSYHMCGASEASGQAIDASGYPGCAAKAEGDSVSTDDFFIDVDLMWASLRLSSTGLELEVSRRGKSQRLQRCRTEIVQLMLRIAMLPWVCGAGGFSASWSILAA